MSARVPREYRRRVRADVRRAADRLPLLVANALQQPWFVPRTLRFLVLRAWGVDTRTRLIGEGCWFGGRQIAIGPHTFVNMRCVFDNLAPISIGASCRLAIGVMVLTSTHQPGDSRQRAGDTGGEPVVIGDGCWIGSGAIILPGVTVGYGCVVGAGAVVTKDCEPNGLYAGNPARRIRDLAP